MSSRAGDPIDLIPARGSADRRLAGLLSALAGAPDAAGAASFLLAELGGLTGSSRLVMLRLDEAHESLVVTAAAGATAPVDSRVFVSEVHHPLVVSTFSLTPLGGHGPLRVPGFEDDREWTAIPMAQPHYRGAPAVMPAARAKEMLEASTVVHALPGVGRTVGTSPAGVIVLDGELAGEVLTDAVELVTLASPVIARIASLQHAWEERERLTQQTERLTVMVDSLPDPVVITDAANNTIAQNHRAERLLYGQEGDSPGRRRAIELNNLLFTSFLSRAAMTGARTEGMAEAPRELNLVDPDEGNDLLFEVLAHPLSERAAPEGAVISVLRDVTDLRRAANELERQVQRVRQAEYKAAGERDRLNLILENVADPILVTDERSNIILMNEQAEQLFQMPAEATPSRREVQAIQGNDTKFTSFISEFALGDEQGRRERMALSHPRTGAPLPVEVVSGKIRNPRGEPIAIVSVLHDRTKEVEVERLYEALKKLNSELEERIREATADLAEQNARLQWQSQEVERANKLKSEFLASMSHELRTPINALIGYTALMLDGVLGEINPKQKDALIRGRAAAEHLLALINDILDLAKIEAGKMPLHVEVVMLREVVTEVSLQVEPMLRKKGLDLGIDVAADCPPLQTDRTKVKQILLNLLSNAVKFTPRGRVSVVARCAPGGVRVDVVDTGIGIRVEDQHAIFEDFRQVDQSRTREHGGTGLGLSITRKLLERLGGSVSVQSVYGDGSTFSVYLPVRIPASLNDETPAIALPAV